MRAKADRGEHCGGPLPYGWSVSPDGQLEREDSEQATIFLARSIREDDRSYRWIGDELIRRGHPPRKGNRWYPNQVMRMMIDRGPPSA